MTNTEERKAQLTTFIQQVLSTVVPMFVDSLVKEDAPPPENTNPDNEPPFKFPELENCVLAYELPNVGGRTDIKSPAGEGWKLSSLETSTEKGCVYGYWFRIKPETDTAKTDAPPPIVDTDEP